MPITQKDLTVGVSGASIGIIQGELLQHAERRRWLSERQARILTGLVGTGTLGAGIATVAGYGPLPASLGVFASGVGAGTLSWYGARDAGIAPRLTVEIPDSVNLANPVVNAATFGVIVSALGGISYLLGTL